MESDIVFVLSYQIIIFKKLVYKILYSIHILFNVKIGTCWYNDLMTALQVDHSTTVDYRTLGTFKDVSLSSMNLHFPDTLLIRYIASCDFPPIWMLEGVVPSSPICPSHHIFYQETNYFWWCQVWREREWYSFWVFISNYYFQNYLFCCLPLPPVNELP